MAKTDKILGLGNALVDIMTKLQNDNLLKQLNLPKGSMQLVDSDTSVDILNKTKELTQTLTSGGSAANTIHGLAILGVDTGFIGKVGDDSMGDVFSSDMKKSGIKPQLLKSKTPTGKAIALVSPDSERTFATYLGAAVELTAQDITENMFDGYQYFHIEGYLVQNHELIEESIKMAKQKGLKISLDLASYNVVEDNLDFLNRVVQQYVDIVFANEEEAKAFTGKEPEEALDIISGMCDIAIVKIGKDGSLIKTNGITFKSGVVDAKRVDTTGAGDLYAAGFLYGLINNKTMKECGYIGALLAGKVIETMGAKITEDNWKIIKADLDKK
jgi:sugar/nucleoside kinase (ribokinase family)